MKKIIEYFTIEEARANYPYRALKITHEDKIRVCQQDNQHKEAVDVCPFCDICGKEICDEYGNFEGISIEQHWGYSSSKDLEYHELDLCEKCYDAKLLALVRAFGTIREYS